jgi:hypothetical protein
MPNRQRKGFINGWEPSGSAKDRITSRPKSYCLTSCTSSLARSDVQHEPVSRLPIGIFEPCRSGPMMCPLIGEDRKWRFGAVRTVFDPFRTFPCLLAFRPGLPKLHTARPKSAIGFWSGHILAMRGCRRCVRGRNRAIARRRAAHAGLSAQEPEPLGKARWRRVITSGHNGLTSLDSLRPRKCFGCLFSAPASCRAERRLWRG